MTDGQDRTRRGLLVPLIFGLAGFAVLVSLGIWQVQRLTWKEALLAEIAARIDAAPVALPEAPDAARDRFLPVRVRGRTTGEELTSVSTMGEAGAGFRLISAFETEDGRRIMVDEGFIRSGEREIERPGVAMTVSGNLHWPDEADRFTPAPEADSGLWYARDVAPMAEALGTEPVMVVAKSVTGADARATPQPVTTEGIPNSHLGYAIQWFGLAAVWAGMTLYLLWRIRRRSV